MAIAKNTGRPTSFVESSRPLCGAGTRANASSRPSGDHASDDGALPGGNAKSFDWRILAGRDMPVPWMLAGGLTADNVAEAVRVTDAPIVDVSSGVEATRGVKSIDKIRGFLKRAHRIG